jgi:uncharacterized membrane protein
MDADDAQRARADRNAGIVLGAAVFATGLVAGLYYFSSIAVMPALTAADDRTLVDAMQQMIDEIENPAFFATFLGAPVLAAVALIQARRSGSARIAGWIVVALALYAAMVVITFAVHIPLNDDLKEAGDPARIEDLAAVRDDFVTPWVAWDIVRTVTTTAAFGCLAWALVLRGRMERAGPGMTCATRGSGPPRGRGAHEYGSARPSGVPALGHTSGSSTVRWTLQSGDRQDERAPLSF